MWWSERFCPEREDGVEEGGEVRGGEDDWRRDVREGEVRAEHRNGRECRHESARSRHHHQAQDGGTGLSLSLGFFNWVSNDEKMRHRVQKYQLVRDNQSIRLCKCYVLDNWYACSIRINQLGDLGLCLFFLFVQEGLPFCSIHVLNLERRGKLTPKRSSLAQSPCSPSKFLNLDT